uniref:Signal peptidase complex catalytic subunit SEC11 n=4 Tax=Passeriformes TaxID=9126 RepID=A0A8C5JH20_JUNHY
MGWTAFDGAGHCWLRCLAGWVLLAAGARCAGLSGLKCGPAPFPPRCPVSRFPRGGSGCDVSGRRKRKRGRAGAAVAVAAAAAMLSLDFLDDVRRMNKRQLYYQVLNFGMIVSSALMIWKGLMVVTGSESPIVVVLSGSMEPAFHRGDLLFLTNRIEDPIRVGEIVVFRIEGREIPIVHRVLKIHEKQNGDIKFLTKGDNNAVDDRGLYKQGQHWLEKKDVVGRARGFVPYIGIVTILMNDYPKFKYAVLFLLGLFVLVHRE